MTQRFLFSFPNMSAQNSTYSFNLVCQAWAYFHLQFVSCFSSNSFHSNSFAYQSDVIKWLLCVGLWIRSQGCAAGDQLTQLQDCALHTSGHATSRNSAFPWSVLGCCRPGVQGTRRTQHPRDFQKHWILSNQVPTEERAGAGLQSVQGHESQTTQPWPWSPVGPLG